MKIISKFKDYYDHAVYPSMIDKNVVFVRNTEIVDHDFKGSLPKIEYHISLG